MGYDAPEMATPSMQTQYVAETTCGAKGGGDAGSTLDGFRCSCSVDLVSVGKCGFLSIVLMKKDKDQMLIYQHQVYKTSVSVCVLPPARFPLPSV